MRTRYIDYSNWKEEEEKINGMEKDRQRKRRGKKLRMGSEWREGFFLNICMDCTQDTSPTRY